MKQKSQSGTILGFIVVGIILVGILLGGVYALSHQKEAAPIRPTPSPLKPQEKPKDQPANPQQPGSSEKSVPPAQPVTSQLPQTGIQETLGTLLVLGVMSGVAVSYLRSRRYLSSL